MDRLSDWTPETTRFSGSQVLLNCGFFVLPHYGNRRGAILSIRAGDWTLIEFQEDNHVGLYHFQDDIGEEDDLSGGESAHFIEMHTPLKQ